jgi:sterol desaturase/sphingolipid hydroxylase (fatty acid hydroxylase superfamily)
MNIILMAVPGFFILIAIEMLINHLRGTNYYRLNDAINSLSMGMLSRVTGAMYALIPFSLYAYSYQSYALFSWEDNWVTYITAFVLYDFCYYWNHRIGHVVNIGWASHVIHHSSEEYNLTTALRQTSIPNPLGALCFVPLAFFGFEPWLLLAVGSLNLIYQYWVHTQIIDRMPEWFEAIFVTPSNHRVHHAKNKVYVDKNYGGVFILWDRFFKTFQPELKEEKVVFGISTQLASWNPVWGNVKVLGSLMKDAWGTKNWFDKFTLWFRKTGYRPADMEEKFPVIKSNLAGDKYDPALTKASKWYIFIQYLYIAPGLLSFMALIQTMKPAEIIISGMALTFALFSLGKVQENSPQSMTFETIKFFLCSVTAGWIFMATPIVGITVAAVSVSMLVLFMFIQKQEQPLQA